MEMKFSDFLAESGLEPPEDFSIAPAVQERIREKTMKKIKLTGMKKPRRIVRVLAVAAVIAALSAGVWAAGLSLRDMARADKGLSEPIPEWTEYGADAPAPSEGENRVELLSTMCSGTQLTAYLRVSPISPEIAASLAARDGVYAWDVGHMEYDGEDLILNASHVSYDEDTQSALVRAEFFGVEPGTSITFGPALYKGLEPEVVYDAVDIPVTESQALSVQVDYPLPQDENQGAMRASEVRVYAGYVEVRFDLTPLQDVRTAAGLTAAPTPEDVLAFHDSCYERLERALADARLNYADGTSEVIAEMESPFAGGWIWESGSDYTTEAVLEMDETAFQYHTVRAIDLSQVASVTIGGITYSLR